MCILPMIPETSFSGMQSWQLNYYLFLMINFGIYFIRSEDKVLVWNFVGFS